MRTNKYLFCFFLFLNSCGFSYRNLEERRVQREIEKGSYEKAIYLLSRVIKRNSGSDKALKAAIQAGEVSLLKTQDFYSAIHFFQYIVLHSQQEEQRHEAQEKIAHIYFDRLNAYEKAIIEYSKLVSIPLLPIDKVPFQIKIAKAFFYLNKFDQSLAEINSVLREKLTEDQEFLLRNFKANVLLTQKEYSEAIEELTLLRDKFPIRSQKEKVSFTIAMAYEDMNEFEKAVDTLEEMKSRHEDPAFIEIKIKRLMERIFNQPGKIKRR